METPAFKLSARAQARARRPAASGTASKGLASPRQSSQQRQHAGLSSESFRSPRVLAEISELERQHVHVRKQPLSPQEALARLRQAVSRASHDGSIALDASTTHRVLLGLEAACWRRFPGQDADTESSRVLHSQLLRATEEQLCSEQKACESLRQQLQLVAERNNELPHLIEACEGAVKRAVACAGENPRASARRLGITTLESQTPANMREEVTRLQRRQALRSFALDEQREAISELLTRRSELKKQSSVVAAEVKKEEQANKLRAKRLEDTRVGTVDVDGRLSASTEAKEKLRRAVAKREELQMKLEARTALVRTRTEAIFDVRNQVRELNDARAEVESALANLEAEAAHVRRACTPRPDWDELQSATVVTTAVDRADATVKLRMGANRRKLSGEEDAEASETRLTHILSSNWSTIAKVGAMAVELARMRSRDHAGDTISAEQAKLDALQKEIVRMLQQLEAVKAQHAA